MAVKLVRKRRTRLEMSEDERIAGARKRATMSNAMQHEAMPASYTVRCDMAILDFLHIPR